MKKFRTTNIDEIQDPDIRGSYPAMLRAAERAKELAIQTNTGLVVSENGKIVFLDADKLRSQAALDLRNL